MSATMRGTVLVLAVLALAACGDDQPAAGTGDEAIVETADTADAPPDPVADESPLKVAELEAYVRGMQKELAMRGDISAKLKQARDAKDQAAEARLMLEMATLEVDQEGARAAGLSETRYVFVRDAVETTLSKVEMKQTLHEMTANADTGELPEDMRRQLEESQAGMQAELGDPYAGMAPEVAAAFKARQAELSQLRAQGVAALMNAAG